MRKRKKKDCFCFCDIGGKVKTNKTKRFNPNSCRIKKKRYSCMRPTEKHVNQILCLTNVVKVKIRVYKATEKIHRYSSVPL